MVAKPEVNDGSLLEGLEWSMAEHLRDVADEARRMEGAPWALIFHKWGSLEAWLEHCRQKRSADPDRKIVQILQSLMRTTGSKPRGQLHWSGWRETLLADRPLAAYWLSVSQAGGESWNEERERIRSAGSIRKLLPVWRAWGQMLLDSGAIDGLDTAFPVAGGKG